MERHFDVFVHSWAPSLESRFRQIFRFTRSLFEDNGPVEAKLFGPGGKHSIFPAGSDWHQISYALSIARGAAMVLEHAQQRGGPFYERVIFSRADTLVVKDLILRTLPPRDDLLYVSGQWQKGLSKTDLRRKDRDVQVTGDFHHITSTVEQIKLLSRLPQILANSTLPVLMHRWFWQQVASSGHGYTVQTDGFISGWHEEVYRKLPIAPMRCLGLERLTRYGMLKSDWDALLPMRDKRECKGEVRRMIEVESTNPYGITRRERLKRKREQRRSNGKWARMAFQQPNVNNGGAFRTPG